MIVATVIGLFLAAMIGAAYALQLDSSNTRDAWRARWQQSAKPRDTDTTDPYSFDVWD